MDDNHAQDNLTHEHVDPIPADGVVHEDGYPGVTHEEVADGYPADIEPPVEYCPEQDPTATDVYANEAYPDGEAPILDASLGLDDYLPGVNDPAYGMGETYPNGYQAPIVYHEPNTFEPVAHGDPGVHYQQQEHMVIDADGNVISHQVGEPTPLYGAGNDGYEQPTYGEPAIHYHQEEHMVIDADGNIISHQVSDPVPMYGAGTPKPEFHVPMSYHGEPAIQYQQEEHVLIDADGNIISHQVSEPVPMYGAGTPGPEFHVPMAYHGAPAVQYQQEEHVLIDADGNIISHHIGEPVPMYDTEGYESECYELPPYDEPTEQHYQQDECMVLDADGNILNYQVGEPVPLYDTGDYQGDYPSDYQSECYELPADETGTEAYFPDMGYDHSLEIYGDDSGYQPDAIEAEASPNAPGLARNVTLNVSAGGWTNIPGNGWTSGIINVTSNTIWSIARSATWMNPSITIASWTGNRSFSVHVAANTSTAARNGNITLRAGTITRTVTFHQLGVVANTLNVSTGGWNSIPATNWNSGTINVTSNTNWNLSRSVTWLNPSIGLGGWSGNRSFTVNVAANNTASARSGNITVSGAGVTRNISFQQLGAVVNTLNVSTGGWNSIPATNWNSGTVNVISNITWNLSRSVTWLTPSLSLGNWSGNRSFTVNVAANTTANVRTGNVTVSGGGITRNISFQQLGAATLTVSSTGWNSIPGNGWTSGTINVTSNGTWTLARSVTWLTPSLGLGNWTGNRSFTVAVAANTTANARTGNVTVSAAGITRNISFQQLGAVTLTVSIGGWNSIPANGWTSGAINVTSNGTWTLSRSVTWLTPSLGLGSWTGNRSFTVAVAANTTTATRTGNVTVAAAGITRNISFQQLGAVTLTVSATGWSNIQATGWTSPAINVTSNGTWTLSRSVTWLTPSLGLGNWTGNRSFTVAVAANTTTVARTGNVTVSVPGITRNISFQQLAATTLTVSTTGWSSIPANGWTSGAINVTSNGTWTLSRSVTWLTPSLGLGNWTGNRSFTVAVAANTTANARTGNVTVSAAGITRNISFQQLGAVTLTVSTGGWNSIPANGWTSGAINVTSNGTWTLSRSVTWLTPSLGLGNWTGNRSFTVVVAANTTTVARSGNVTLSSGGVTRNISFQQLASVVSTLTVSPASFVNVAAAGMNSQVINVTSNVTWTLGRSVTWLTPSIALGNYTGNRSFTVNVAANTGAARSGNVTVVGGGITRNISFQQLVGQLSTPAVTITAPAHNSIKERVAFNITWTAVSGASYVVRMRDITTSEQGPMVITDRQMGTALSTPVTQAQLREGHRYRIAVGSTIPGRTIGWREAVFSVRNSQLTGGDASPNADMIGFNHWFVPTSTAATSGLRGFGGMGFINNRWHMGSDYYASNGRDVVAVADGLVMRVRGPVVNSGTYAQSVIIRHDGPFTVRGARLNHIYSVYQVYGPNGGNRALFVHPGDRVSRGQRIARNGTLPLHFEVRRPSGATPANQPDDLTTGILNVQREIDWNYHIDPRWIFNDHRARN